MSKIVGIWTAVVLCWLAYLSSVRVVRGLEGLQDATEAASASGRYLMVESIAEQRNSRLVSFTHIIELARVSQRTLIQVPLVEEYNFSIHEYGVSTISYPEAKKTVLEKKGEMKEIAFYSCRDPKVPCLPCPEATERGILNDINEYLDLSPAVKTALLGPADVVRIRNYKRCGRRDDKIFARAQSLFLDYNQQFHLFSEEYLRKHGQAQGEVYVATQLRTEKWNPVLPERCLRGLLDSWTLQLQRAQGMQAKSVYIASDALPGGQVFSSTYKKGPADVLAKRNFYEGLAANMTEIAEKMGLSVIEHFPGTKTVSSSIVDQLICSKASIFVGTCALDTSLLIGDKDCTFPRRVCGNYGMWIFRYRDRMRVPVIPLADSAASDQGSATAYPKLSIPYTTLI